MRPFHAGQLHEKNHNQSDVLAMKMTVIIRLIRISQSEKLLDENDFFEDIVTPKTTCVGTNTYVSRNSNLDVTYKVSHTIREAPKEKLEEAEAGSNYKRVMTNISLPCHVDVTYDKVDRTIDISEQRHNIFRSHNRTS